MINLIIFVFMWFVAEAFDARDCRAGKNDAWLCEYMETHNKRYASASEFTYRANMLRNIHPAAHFGLTSKSDVFPHELRSNSAFAFGHHKTVRRPSHLMHKHKDAVPALPPLDWRTSGRVTSVKDQGNCGGCFAFAAVSVLEFWEGEHPKSLSAQIAMDCTSGTRRPNVGCDGGLMEYVFEYARSHPIPLENEYPFREHAKTCPRGSLRASVEAKDYRVLMIQDNPKAEQQLEHILHTYGPVSVGVDSSNMNNYKSGIFPASHCSTDIDHAVTIVGYTKDAWIIKNSWGKYWGRDGGYLYLERGKNACGVAEYIVYIKNATPTHKKMSTKWHMVV